MSCKHETVLSGATFRGKPIWRCEACGADFFPKPPRQVLWVPAGIAVGCDVVNAYKSRRDAEQAIPGNAPPMKFEEVRDEPQ